MRKRIIAGNWKMNKRAADLAPFFADFNHKVLGGLNEGTKSVEIVIAVPFTLLKPAVQCAAEFGVEVASQNCHWAEAGAFTGEVSPSMIVETGARWTVIGHSERRQYFGETDETVAKRIQGALAAGLKVIACVGETLGERQGGETEAVVSRQLASVLAGAEGARDRLVMAYEPVWAIGTGLAATAEQAEEVHAFLRARVQKAWGREAGDAMRILYGGSMTPANVQVLVSQANIDGGLIGGASLKPDDFAAMVSVACR